MKSLTVHVFSKMVEAKISLHCAALRIIRSVRYRTQCGLCFSYIAFWRHCLDNVEIDCNRFEVETLLNLRMHKAKMKSVEIPSFEHFRIHGESNLDTFRDGWRVLKTHMRERKRTVAQSVYQVFA